jgi:hypothetical protein
MSIVVEINWKIWEAFPPIKEIFHQIKGKWKTLIPNNNQKAYV